MASYKYDRLSAQDNSFLVLETKNQHMHVSSTQIFDASLLTREDGGIDVESIERFTASVLYRIPRYRQKLCWIPFESTPVWVDDPHFRIDYHIRHTALPRPGSEAQLKELAARIQAQQLDRRRPMWEIWVVEGIEGERFAMIAKIHHCMIDGSSGVDISQILQSPTPDREIRKAPAYVPRAAPTRSELLLDTWRDRIGMPARLLRDMQQFRAQTPNFGEELRIRAEAIRSMYADQAQGSSETPLNGDLSPHRAIDWMRSPLDEVKEMKRGLGCTLNDVVLTILTSAFREYLIHRRVDPGQIEFRAQTPVSVRSAEEKGRLGNRVSSWLVPLPVHEADPRKQLALIHERTQELKRTRQALGVDLMMKAMSVMPTALMSLGVQAASGSMNTLITNVPGPQFPLYLLGAELLDMFPVVPLLPNVGLGVALISYNGRLCWGFNADPELVPDLEVFVEKVGEAYANVRKLANS